MTAERETAYRQIGSELDVAARIHGVRSWLAGAPAEETGNELLRCLVAADCWHARLPSPRRASRGAAWRQYLAQRQAAVRAALPPSLAVAAVLARVPCHWIPESHVHAELQHRFKPQGLTPSLLELRLVPPVLGGDDWVRRHAGDGARRLPALAAAAPVAALLHWQRRSAAAVVVERETQLVAFGSAFAPDGEAIDVSELCAAFVVEPAAPPFTGLARLARRCGVGDLAWRWTRAWRVRRAGGAHAAF